MSNSNTAAVFDGTNPVASTIARAIGTVNLATGQLQVTSVDAYSGNSGRAAALVGGTYYRLGTPATAAAKGPR